MVSNLRNRGVKPPGILRKSDSSEKKGIKLYTGISGGIYWFQRQFYIGSGTGEGYCRDRKDPVFDSDAGNGFMPGETRIRQ